MNKESLEVMLARGLSLKQMADHLGVNRTTVRHYVKKFSLNPNFKPGNKQLDIGEHRCCECSETAPANFYANNRYRCKKCETTRVTLYRQERKAREVQKRGGCCVLCGYNKYIGALEFHHKDPSEKELDWTRLVNRSQAIIDRELDKCLLVCSNCHRELHAQNRSNID